MRPRTLRGLGLVFLAVFLATAILVGLSIYLAMHAALDREVDRRLASIASVIVPDGTPPPLVTTVARIGVLERRRESRDIGFMLLDRAGRRVAGTVRIALPPPGFSAIDRDDRIPGLVRGRAFVLPVGRDHVLALIAESEPIDHFDSRFIGVLLIGLASLAVMVVAGVVLLTGAIGRRMAELRETAATIIDGDLTRRVRADGSGGEFDTSAQLLNRMLDRIQELMDGIRHVAHDAAHDLRTPLARLRGQIAAIVRQAEGSVLQDAAEQALQQTDDTLALCTSILRIAEIDGGSARSHFTAVDLAPMVEDLAAAYLPTIEEQGRTLALEADVGAQIAGDRQLLVQLFANLIENWLTHTDPGVAMTLSIVRQHDRVLIIAADRGSGIAAFDRAVALRRFARLGITGGHGLGLPLVAAIVRLHRGEMTLGDADPGLAVTLAFPATAQL